MLRGARTPAKAAATDDARRGRRRFFPQAQAQPAGAALGRGRGILLVVVVRLLRQATANARSGPREPHEALQGARRGGRGGIGGDLTAHAHQEGQGGSGCRRSHHAKEAAARTASAATHARRKVHNSPCGARGGGQQQGLQVQGARARVHLRVRRVRRYGQRRSDAPMHRRVRELGARLLRGPWRRCDGPLDHRRINDVHMPGVFAAARMAAAAGCSLLAAGGGGGGGQQQRGQQRRRSIHGACGARAGGGGPHGRARAAPGALRR